MDVSIAVSLIRGQMGTVVERAVNGAVETVLAEMLKVVGVKFEELKAQVALMKKNMTIMQREKAQKEKENDNIRAKLRYTELKLKYYRQGVEEELQQRVSASALVHIHPPSGPGTGQRGSTGLSHTETEPSCSSQSRTGTRSTSPQSTSRHSARVHCQPDVCGTSTGPSDLLLSVSTANEALDSSTALNRPMNQDLSVHKKEEQEDEWTITVQPPTEGVDAAVAMSSIQAITFEPGQQSNTVSLNPEHSTHADSSTLPPSPPRVKQEEEVICIKEDPEEEQDVMAGLDCQVQLGHVPESEATRNVTNWSGPQTSGRNPSAAGSSSGPNTYVMLQPVASLPSVSASPSSTTPRQSARPWTRPDLTLYEEYKRRRNELRRLSLNKRREMEKALPQPLLSDLVRERREKTRLRVARWRAKRKLQACLNQDQAQGGAAGISQRSLPVNNQQLRATCAPGSSSQQRQSSALHLSNSFLCNIQPTLSFMVPSSSSSSLLLRGPSVTTHASQHMVTSSSSYPQINLSQQSISLTDTEIIE